MHRALHKFVKSGNAIEHLGRLVFICLLLLSAVVRAEDAGSVTHLSGTLVAKPLDGDSRLLSVKSLIREGDTITTQDNTYARIRFVDGGEVVLRPNSQFKVESYRYEYAKPESDNVFVSLLKGGMRAVTGLIGKRNKEKISYQTPTATIGIRGTHFGLLMCQGDCIDIQTVSGQSPADGLHIDVVEGVILASNSVGQQVIGAGQFAYVQSKTTPPTLVPASQGIRVTMPSSISQNAAEGRSVGDSRQSADCTLQ